jgi:hypothetical protein
MQNQLHLLGKRTLGSESAWEEFGASTWEAVGSIYPPNREVGFVSFVHACVHERTERHPLYASIRQGIPDAASPPVAAVGLDWACPGARPWVRPWARWARP